MRDRALVALFAVTAGLLLLVVLRQTVPGMEKTFQCVPGSLCTQALVACDAYFMLMAPRSVHAFACE